MALTGVKMSAEDQAAALEAVKGFAADGYVWVAKISLDASLSVQDERFRSRIAQMAYDASGDARAASNISKVLDEMADEAAHAMARRDGRKAIEWQCPLACEVIRAVHMMAIEELQRRGHKVVSCEDGVLVFVKSRRAAERVSRSMRRYLQTFLYATAEDEGADARPVEQVDLFGFCISADSDDVSVSVRDSLLQKLKRALKRMTSRSWGIAFAARLRGIARVVREGSMLLALADDASAAVDELNEWAAARFRMVLWKKWKLVRTRISALESIGVEHARAMILGKSHDGFWAISNCEGLRQELSYSKLRRMGFSFYSVHLA